MTIFGSDDGLFCFFIWFRIFRAVFIGRSMRYVASCSSKESSSLLDFCAFALAIAHAVITAEYVITFGSTPVEFISFNISHAFTKSPVSAQPLITAVYAATSGAIPVSFSICLMRPIDSFISPPLAQADIAKRNATSSGPFKAFLLLLSLFLPKSFSSRCFIISRYFKASLPYPNC